MAVVSRTVSIMPLSVEPLSSLALPPVQIRLLGGISVRVKGKECVGELQRQTAHLLALLVLGKKSDVLVVQDLLWPDHDTKEEGDKKRDTNFRQHWMHLTKVLHQEDIVCLQKHLGQVWLDEALVWTDVWELERNVTKHVDVLNLYQGELLPHCTELWAVRHRQTLKLRAMFLLKKQILWAEQRGDVELAFELVEQAQSLLPDETELVAKSWQYRRQMGRQSEVLAEAEAIDKDTEATDAMHELARRWLCLLTPPVVALALEPLNPLPVPLPLSSLLGREDTLEALLGALLHPHAFITLYGEGGIGKTRLALAATDALATVFTGGIVFVDLTQIAVPSEGSILLRDNPLSQVWQHIALALGMPHALHSSDIIRTLTTRPILLVLDNAEHVHHALREAVSTLRAECTRLHVLVTSREPLRLIGERLFPLSPLPLEIAQELFWVRAPKMRPTMLTPAEQDALDSICAFVGHLPLGIELAAMTLEQHQSIVSLKESLLASAWNVRSTLSDPREQERFQNLEKTIAWSYQLRTLEEQQTFRSLAVFLGNAPPEALAFVCNKTTQETNVLLDRLVDVSLVKQRGNFVLAPPLRQFAQERLQQHQEYREAQARHALWYKNLVTATPPPSLDVLEANRSNTEQAMRFYVSQKDYISAQSMGVILGRFWHRHGSVPVGYELLCAALDYAEPFTEDDNTIEVLLGAGNLAYAMRLPEANKFFERALALSQIGQDSKQEARARGSLGLAAMNAKDFNAAETHFAEAQRLFGQHNDVINLDRTHSNLVLSIIEQGKHDVARQLCQEHIQTMRERGNEDALIAALNHAAYLYGRCEDMSSVHAILQEVLPLATSHQHWRGMLQSLCHAINLVSPENDPERVAMLLGILHFQTAQHGQVLPPDVVQAQARLFNAVEKFLGSTRLQVLSEKGAKMPLPEMVNFVLAGSTS